MLSMPRIAAFQKKILDHYRRHGRTFAWRTTRDPYRILVSEIMLQQTQTERVRGKYAEFLTQFPSLKKLAAASRADVLKAWQGLGYNRRALALQQCARTLIKEYGGVLPRETEKLQELPGIGPYTAGALACFCWGEPALFIETNIRSVYLSEFFTRRLTVSDKEIAKYVSKTIDARDSRRWYYALMDYGVMLKKNTRGLNRKSKHYSKQSKFKGSNREVRGQILRELSKADVLNVVQLQCLIGRPKAMVALNLKKLIAEGFIEKRGARLRLAI